uniref:Hepatic triacylglycerol lipase n=1 Tax=Electrophorus electricus TaxID=8005 RepID=A0A4W4H0S0_ELEEL
MKSSVRVFFFLLLIFAFSKAVKAEGNVKGMCTILTVPLVVKSTFHMHLQGNTFEDTCTIVPFHSETLSTCNYNSSSPLVIIIHGWTVGNAPRQTAVGPANAFSVKLIVCRRLPASHHEHNASPYGMCILPKRKKDFYTWLETTQLSMDKVHLIGYSLGAHVAGFAGSHFTGERKLGRITGLDPAGPQFEGVPASDRLSPDDAKFVDTIHTFSKSSIGFTLGIRQLVGHVDFYPNGGSFQPGCQMTDMYNNLYQFGLEGLPKTVKCTHQRAVHLFTDSILNMDQQMTAYRCRDDGAFDKGLCLDCKKNRCNILGYNVRRVFKRGNNKGLYLKTGSQTPFKVYHYQIKVLLKNLTASVQVSVSISLIGTKGQSEYLPVTLSQEHAENKTYSALAAVGLDMGDLQAVRLHWEGEAAWTSWWRRVSSIMSGGSRRHDTELSMWRIRLKSGESQEKIWFCGKTGDTTHFKPSQEQEFIRCKDISKKMINVTKPQDQESGKA